MFESTQHPFTDMYIYWPGLRIGVKETNLLTGELYFWVDRVESPTKSALRKMKKLLDTIKRPATCNVAAEDQRALRFAEFFGFKTVQVVDGTCIMARN